MAKVAIITRTKDRPTFLRRALQSVHCQTYREFEHIIVNDGGDQAQVMDIIDKIDQSWQQKITVIHRQESSNAPDTIFNDSVDASSAEYVVIHDDDDSWHEDFLKLSVEELDSNDAIGGVVARTDKVIEELSANSSEIKTVKTEPYMADRQVINLYRQCMDNQLTPISFLYRRSAYEAVGRYDDSLPVLGDWEFGIRFLMQYDVEVIDQGYALAFYHHRKYKPGQQGNTSFSGNEKHRYYSNKIMNKHLRKELEEGRLGVGYIMSKLKYEQHFVSRMTKGLLPKWIIRLFKRRVEY